ncbi:MAG: 16S rRNA (cytosine(967)-C(5))-methyltransferase RsmB [Candidatus Magnetoovum sp. WYHC-5]|nr:16S rRNA (cytosine(967)-C(5))-methyltransferase RsmB [Candidatus Magnetoovum sp. WYHC-5]
MELVYGVLRQRSALDWMFGRFLKNPLALGAKTLYNLRLAVYQIMYMATADRAAVYEAVEIEKSYHGKPSLVNAVLRSVLRSKTTIALPMDETLSSLSIRTSTPMWLIKRWHKRFGYSGAEALCMKNNTQPPMALRVNSTANTAKELNRLDIKYRQSQYLPNSIILEDHVPYSKLTTLKGSIAVQDEGAQLAGFLINPQKGQRMLDACSAPGIKATHMARLSDDSGLIVACDLRIERFKKFLDNINNFKLHSIKPVVADSAQVVFKQLFDKILLDAPCSSIGTIRRNPDVKYKRKTRELLSFKETQLNMLVNLSQYLKKGGTLLYSVCSTEPEEGEEVIYGFLKLRQVFRIINLAPIIKEAYAIDLTPFITKDGFIRTYPHVHDMDGFFYAGLTL